MAKTREALHAVARKNLPIVVDEKRVSRLTKVFEVSNNQVKYFYRKSAKTMIKCSAMIETSSFFSSADV